MLDPLTHPDVSNSAGSSMLGELPRFAKEPLLHVALAGAAIYLLFRMYQPDLEVLDDQYELRGVVRTK